MPKIQKQNEIKETQEVILTFEQVKNLAEEVLECGEEEFLIRRKAIKIAEDKSWVVMCYEGLRGCVAEFGYQFPSDCPYTFWQQVLGQVWYYIKRRDEKYKEQQAILAQQNI